MSFIKKIMSLLLILVIFINFIRITTSANEDNNIEVNNNFVVYFSVENNTIDLSNLKINLYSSTPVYENGEIINFNNTFYKSYYVENNSIIFERPTEYFLLELDLKTLPNNCGCDTSSIFVGTSKTNATFNISEIYDIETQFLDGEVEVKFYNSNQEIIYVDYSSEITEQIPLNSYQLTIKYGNEELQQNFNVRSMLYTHENELLNDLILEDGDLETIENYNLDNDIIVSNIQSYQKENSRFIIYYDAATMDVGRAENVANEIELIEQFYQNLGFIMPKSNCDNEFQIWLKHHKDIDNYGITYSNTTLVEELAYSIPTSYIELNYELVEHTSPFSKASDRGFVAILAHEFFHAIQWEMLGLFDSTSDAALEWMSESFATMFGFSYLNSLGIKDEYFRKEFTDYFITFIKNTSSLDSLISMDEYKSFLFPVYIVNKFGYQPIKEIILSYREYYDTFETIDSVLNDYGSSFSDLFLEFSITNFNPLNSYQNFNEWYISQFKTESYIESYSQTKLSNKNEIYSLQLSYASNKYFYLESEECENYDAYVTISFDNIENLNISSLRVTDSNGHYYRTYALEGNSITIPQYNFGFHTCDKLFFVITNNSYNSSPINITYNVSIEHHKTELLLGQETFIDEHLHTPNLEHILEFIPQTTGLYEFEMLVTATYGGIYLEGDLQILDSSYNVIKKFNIDDCDNLAINVTDSNSVICKLLGNETYYLKASYVSAYINVSVLVNQINEDSNLQTIELNSNDEYICESSPMIIGDNLIQLHAPRLGYYDITFEYEGDNNEEMAFAIFKVNNNDIVEVNAQIIDSYNNIFKDHILFEQGCTYYLGYFGSSGEDTFNLSISRYIGYTVLVGTDPNSNVTVGSEVLLNGGLYGGTSIAQGLNRCIYVNSSYPSKSRLSYKWYSLDESKAVVSKYGTVTAIESQEETTVKIFAVYKNNPMYVGVIEFTVKPDKSNMIKNVTLTTDKREGDVQTGTEVSENNGLIGGTLMHVGYTRLISFENNSPTSSIQDFVWVSDNPLIVSVSTFGTLTANSKGSATITGVYKYNHNYVGYISIVVE